MFGLFSGPLWMTPNGRAPNDGSAASIPRSEGLGHLSLNAKGAGGQQIHGGPRGGGCAVAAPRPLCSVKGVTVDARRCPNRTWPRRSRVGGPFYGRANGFHGRAAAGHLTTGAIKCALTGSIAEGAPLSGDAGLSRGLLVLVLCFCALVRPTKTDVPSGLTRRWRCAPAATPGSSATCPPAPAASA